MAYQIAAANATFTSATAWQTADATSLLDSEGGNTALTTSYQTSATFTPGAITIDGIAVKIASVAASPSGTITVALDQAGTTVTGTSVTLNVSDLPSCSTAGDEGGWILFRFAASVTLTAATVYGVKATTSAANQVNLWTNGTAANWSRLLRTTTTAAPAAGDTTLVIGEHTGAGTGTNWTITANTTNATAYGPILIGKRGTLAYPTTASTTTELLVTGNVAVYNGGTLNMGTSGAVIPAGSQAILTFNISSGGTDGQYGLTIKNGGTWNAYGAYGAGNFTYATNLNVNVSANTGSFTVNAATNWGTLTGMTEQFALAATSRTYTDCEQISGTTSGTTVTVTAGGGTGGNTTKNAHDGTGLVPAEVLHLTRNVRVRSSTTVTASTSGAAYIDVKATATVTLVFAELYYLGANVAGQRGLEVETTTGSFSATLCSIHDTRNFGLYSATATGSITFSTNVLYNLNLANNSSTYGVYVAATSGAHTMDHNYVVLTTTANSTTAAAVYLADAGSTYTNWVVAGSAGCGVLIAEGAALGTFSGNLNHSNQQSGYNYCGSGNGTYGTILQCNGYRNAVHGFNYTTWPDRVVFDTCSAIGNTNYGWSDQNATQKAAHVWKTCTARSDGTTWQQQRGITSSYGDLYISECSMGVGSNNAHTSYDLNLGTATMNGSVRAVVSDTALGSGSGKQFSHTLNAASYVRYHKFNQTAGDDRSYHFNGSILAIGTGAGGNGSQRHTGSGYSWQMNPTNANRKLILPGPTPEFDTLKIPVASGQTLTLSVWVCASGAGTPGASDVAYNGNAPRLVVAGAVVAGNSASDTVATPDTAWPWTAAVWHQLTATVGPVSEAGTLEAYIDCDGTLGAIYADDFTVTLTGGAQPSTVTLDTPSRGLPVTALCNAAGGMLRMGFTGGIYG